MADKNKGINPVVAGIAGAAVGAVAAAGAIALSDEKNRKKVGKVVKQLKTESAKTVDRLKKEAERRLSDEVEPEEPKKLAGKTTKS